ncbi:tetratricopeptide repeat protein [Patescibacteria group bacterium]|nr:tetratricopeptide repeat protein [Patescibacteria group bacterium]
MPIPKTEIPIKIKKPINLENIITYIFYALVFLLPIFVLPLTIEPFAFSKSILIYLGVGLAFLLWLFARLQKGDLVMPKSSLLLALGGIVLVWLVSSLFSLNAKVSLLGTGYDIGTFFFFLVLGIAMFLISLIFQSEKKVAVFYSLLFMSSILVFAFQILHTVFNITIIPGNIFPFKTSSLIGGWNDFAIFFGFIALSALVFFELFEFSKRIKTLLLLLIALSLTAMLGVNFSTGWFIFGFFVLVFLVYYFSRVPLEQNKGYAGRRLIGLSLFILLLIFFFILARGLIGDLTAFLGTNIIDVRPSWSGTYEVVYKTLSERPILGSGPNTFLYDWLRFKPEAINSTIFWNTRFQSGIGHLPSMLASAGILGGIVLLAFLAFLLYYGLKVISYTKNDFNRVFLVASFLGSLYLWSFVIFYSPGILIFSLAFMATGILIAILARVEKIKTLEISFLKNSKAGFASSLIIILLIIATIFSIYLFIQKYWAGYSYAQALNVLNTEGDLGKTESGVLKAAQLDRQDIYFRGLSELGIMKIQQILNQQGVSEDILRSQFQTALGASIQNAQIAVNLNSLDSLNWMQLARVYESVAPLNIAGAKDFAIDSYNKALEKSPLDPTPYLAMARVEAQLGDINKAREYIDSALEIKGDFAAALFLLAQIEAQEGNLKEAIQRTEQTVLIAANDTGALFQLGLLYYQDKNYDSSRFAFERAVALSPNYSNARYFLGLIYDRKGMKKEAIEQFEKIQELNPGNDEVKNILKNLRSGKNALIDISPPAPSPEERAKPPVE